jgi:hypothetical protein
VVLDLLCVIKHHLNEEAISARRAASGTSRGSVRGGTSMWQSTRMSALRAACLSSRAMMPRSSMCNVHDDDRLVINSPDPVSQSSASFNARHAVGTPAWRQHAAGVPPAPGR